MKRVFVLVLAAGALLVSGCKGDRKAAGDASFAEGSSSSIARTPHGADETAGVEPKRCENETQSFPVSVPSEQSQQSPLPSAYGFGGSGPSGGWLISSSAGTRRGAKSARKKKLARFISCPPAWCRCCGRRRQA